jgi:hypothetical protein
MQAEKNFCPEDKRGKGLCVMQRLLPECAAAGVSGDKAFIFSYSYFLMKGGCKWTGVLLELFFR